MKKLLWAVLGALCAVLIMTAGINLAFRADRAEHPEIAVTASAPAPEPVAPVEVEYMGFLTPELESVIDQTAEFYGVDADLIRGVIWVESRGVHNADNGLCYGLMQLNMDYESTFKAGAHLDDITLPANNIVAGTWWISELLNDYDGNVTLALMAYNLGQTTAERRWNNGEHGTDYSAAVLATIEKSH